MTRQNQAEAGRDRVDILGVAVDRVTVAEALARIDGFLAVGAASHVVTVNPEYVMAAARRDAFRSVLNAADLAVADGVGVTLASRLLGRPVPERITGVGLVGRVAQLATERGASVFLLGARPGVADAAAVALGRRCSQATGRDVVVAGTHAGSPSAAEAAEIVARVRSARPGVLFVAFGAPEQDLWIARHRGDLGVPVMMGVGGAFDFLAGVRRRAPQGMRRVGLEWLWRLAIEPWRWRRQLALPRFAAAVARQRLLGRR
ncbi:MAG: WecB/TagA/CpsF family glycosyltransferase [Anaerolineae bacterium]